MSSNDNGKMNKLNRTPKGIQNEYSNNQVTAGENRKANRILPDNDRQMRCNTCGRFHSSKPGSAWQMIYSGIPLAPDHEVTRCKSCVERVGAFDPQPGIKAKYSTGIIE